MEEKEGDVLRAKMPFTVRKVIEHFRGISEEYATRKGYVHPEHDYIILNFIKENCTQNSKVLEVGVVSIC